MTGQLRTQRLGDSFSDLALNREYVSQLSIIGLGPEVGIGLSVNQLNIDPHLIRSFLDATLKDVRHAKLLRDLGEISRLALIPLCRRARDHLQIRDFSQAC